MDRIRPAIFQVVYGVNLLYPNNGAFGSLLDVSMLLEIIPACVYICVLVSLSPTGAGMAAALPWAKPRPTATTLTTPTDGPAPTDTERQRRKV